VALGGEACAALAVQLLQVVVAVVERVDEVGGGAARLAAGDGAVVKDDHLLPLAREQVGGRHPRDAGADDTHVGRGVLGQRLARGHVARGHPDGNTPPRIGLHVVIPLDGQCLKFP
jgi:hypothetical protein